MESFVESLNIGHKVCETSGGKGGIGIFGLGMLGSAGTEELSRDTFIIVKHRDSNFRAIARIGEVFRGLMNSIGDENRFCIWEPGQDSSLMCGQSSVRNILSGPYFKDEKALMRAFSLVDHRGGVAILCVNLRRDIRTELDSDNQIKDIILSDGSERENVRSIVSTYLRPDMGLFPVRTQRYGPLVHPCTSMSVSHAPSSQAAWGSLAVASHVQITAEGIDFDRNRMEQDVFGEWADEGRNQQRIYVGAQEVSGGLHPFLAMRNKLPMSEVLKVPLMGANGAIDEGTYVVMRVGYPAEDAGRERSAITPSLHTRQGVAAMNLTGLFTFW